MKRHGHTNFDDTIGYVFVALMIIVVIGLIVIMAIYKIKKFLFFMGW